MPPIKKHIKDMLSGRYGTISSARVLMVVFALFAMSILASIIHRMLGINQPELLSVWIGGLPAIGGILVALIATPYTVNKSSEAISDIVSAVSQAKSATNAPTPTAQAMTTNPLSSPVSYPTPDYQVSPDPSEYGPKG